MKITMQSAALSKVAVFAEALTLFTIAGALAQTRPSAPPVPTPNAVATGVVQQSLAVPRVGDKVWRGIDVFADFEYGHDVCYGMITCCNSAWVQGCDEDDFEDVCTIYGGEVVLNPFSDGSINYECHYKD